MIASESTTLVFFSGTLKYNHKEEQEWGIMLTFVVGDAEVERKVLSASVHCS